MNTEGKKVTSTARQLKFMWLGKLAAAYFSLDFALVLLFLSIFIFQIEKQAFGTFDLDTVRNVYSQEETGVYEASRLTTHLEDGTHLDEECKVQFLVNKKEGTYTYRQYADDKLVQDMDVTVFANIIRFTGYAVLLIEIVSLFSNVFGGMRKIRKKLQPLNEMAERANELSQIDFNDTKIHDLEDAIARIKPDESEEIHTTNEDLKGIEDAINNMLVRMHDAYRQQSRFVSDASHELRTPIAVIQGYVNMLDRWGKDDETILNESIDAIKNESEHMKKLVEQLLFLARGDSGRNQMNFEECSLYEIMKEVYEESLMIDEHHVYQFQGDENVKVCGDMAMLKQTARILVDNAAKYTLEKDEIIIRCGMNGDGRPFFSVQDNGIGMKESDVLHVFERFYRSDEARDKRKGGTGLGLSIAKWIVDKHNGYFEVLSREEIGTRLTVVLKTCS